MDSLSTMRIAFFLPNMKGGGAERVALTLIQKFVSRGDDVELILMRAEGDFLSLLPQSVRVVDLQVDRIRATIRPFSEYLRSSQLDAVQVSMWPLTIAAILGRILARRADIRLVISDHTTLSVAFPQKGLFHKLFLKVSIRTFYPLADARIVVSRQAAEDLVTLTGIDRKSVEVIYNPIPENCEEAINKNLFWRSKGRRVLTIGALKTVKNHVLLLRAFAKLRQSVDAQLMIVGEGELRSNIEGAVRDLGLADHVILAGFHLSVSSFYSSSDLFVLSSNHEGYPNVLVEALRCGIPIVSTDCKSGPREILDNGNYGYLVPVGDVTALAEAMLSSLSQEHDSARLKQRAAELNLSNFQQYETIVSVKR